MWATLPKVTSSTVPNATITLRFLAQHDGVNGSEALGRKGWNAGQRFVHQSAYHICGSTHWIKKTMEQLWLQSGDRSEPFAKCIPIQPDVWSNDTLRSPCRGCYDLKGGVNKIGWLLNCCVLCRGKGPRSRYSVDKSEDLCSSGAVFFCNLPSFWQLPSWTEFKPKKQEP